MKDKLIILLAFIFITPILNGDEMNPVNQEGLRHSAQDKAAIKPLVIAVEKDNAPLTFLDADGAPAGILVDIWRLWSQQTGNKIVFISGTRDDTFDYLKTGKADIHAGTIQPDSNMDWMVFSQPLYGVRSHLFYKRNPRGSDIWELQADKKIGIMQGASRQAYLNLKYPEADIILFQDRGTMIRAVLSGEIACMLAEAPSMAVTLEQLGLSGKFEIKYPLINKTIHAGVPRNHPALLALIDDGFNTVLDQTLADIEKRWIRNPEIQYYRPLTGKIRLTEKEKSWLNDHPFVRVGFPSNFPPLHFKENDELKGITPDFLVLISEYSGLQFKSVQFPANQYEVFIKEAKVDITTTFDIPERHAYTINTCPFMAIDSIIIGRNDMNVINSLSALRGKKVASIRGIKIYNRIQEKYPDIILYPTNTIEESLTAVSSGKADVFVASILMVGHLLQHFPTLKIVGSTGIHPEPYMIAVRKDYPELASILNKAIINIPEEKKNAIIQKWFNVHAAHSIILPEILKLVGGISIFFIVVLGLFIYWNKRLLREINERRKVQKALADSEERLNLALDSVTDAIWDWRIDNGETYFSSHWYTIIGYTPEEWQPSYDAWRGLLHPDDRADAERVIRNHMRINEPFEMEYRIRTKHKGWKWIMARGKTVRRDEHGNALRILGTNMDITQRKLYESEREIALHLLRYLQKDTDLYSLLKDIAALLKNWFDSDAVGIRLQQGEDYPYFEAIGFPREFLEMENRLCAIDEKGNLIRDDKGHPVLECICGNVIQRRFDPSLPFYTDNGSFWTNRVTELLADPRVMDWPTCIRSNFYNREYESIALIPLHIGNRSIGLLQFNYIKQDCIDAEKIAVMEQLASNLAIGLSQRTTALALLESERRYRAVFDKAAYSIYLVDPDTGAFFDYNAKAYETLGYTSEEFKNLSVADIETVESPEEIKAHIKKILRQESDMFESRQKTKDGKIRDMLISCSLVSFGEKTYILSVTNDVTEQKKVEKEREHLLSAIEQIEEIIIITDIEGMIFYTNPAFMKITGHSYKEVSGKNIQKYVGLSHHGSSTAMTLSQMILDGTQWHEEVMNKYMDGTPCILEWTVSPVNDKQGNILNFVWIARDVTREQELEKKVAHAQRMESIGNLAGGIAHDFNNILSPIVGMSEMLLEDLSHGSIEYENAGEILKAGMRGSDLVKQILAFSRQSEPRKIPVRVQSVLKEVLRLCRSTIPSNVAINHEIQSDCGLVMADATQLHQVAMNLITNAYHAVEESNGEIFISLKEIEEVPYDLSENILEPGKYAKLTVTDTGCGMESQVIDKIFEPYFTTKKQGKGTGLGLSVVYGIIKDHKGHIDVTSDLGKGSRFNVFLPLIRKSSDTIFSPKPEEYPSGNERILLVDDEEPIVRLLQQALERLGYTITARMSSLDALEAFKAKPDAYDLVITDMSMPNMTGIQLAGKLLKVRAGIPVIICTGFSERITPEIAAQKGIKGVLMKPIAKLDLTRMVRQVLDDTHVTDDMGLAI